MTSEFPVCVSCHGDCLSGILHVPAQPAKRGVVVVVGGPQYRVGSHRQFVLLARDLAAAGIAVMRFDYRGMGDSEGESGTPEPCEHIHADLRSAIDGFYASVPALEEIVLWGLCDGASATLLYAYSDPRVVGVALMNPWISAQGTSAKTYLKHYYTQRLFHWDLWHKVLRGEADLLASLAGFGRTFADSARATIRRSGPPVDDREKDAAPAFTASAGSIQERMAKGLSQFPGRVLLVLSGNDLIAAEFKDMAAKSRQWRRLLRSPRITRHDYPQADHTFSCRTWRDQVATWTKDWIQSW